MSEFENPNSPIKLNWVTIYNFTPEEVSDRFFAPPCRCIAALGRVNRLSPPRRGLRVQFTKP